MKIVDVSNNNGSVDWPGVKRAGIGAAWVKVSEGTGFIDREYGVNNVFARREGLRVGGYHFGHPNVEWKAQADLFLSKLRLQPGDLLPVLDIESTDGCSPAQIEAWAAAFLDHVARKIGQKPVIYSGDYFARTNLGKLVNQYPLWVASYGAKPHLRYAAWQWTDRDALHLDESVSPNPSVLIYKPTLKHKVVKVVKKPLVKPLRAWFAWRLANRKKVAV